MKITNNNGLPEPLVRAIQNDRYSKGKADYSVTELLAPFQATQLRRRHWDEIEEDASERVWALLGQAVHAVLERSDRPDHLQEERISREMSGRVVSGQIDCYHDGVITDYKVTSVWSRVFGDRLHEWEAQTNIYAELYEGIGLKVSGVRVLAIYRDWSEREAKKDQERYPQIPAEIIPLKLWEPEKRQDFIRSRIEGNISAESIPDESLPECTPEEMWEKRPTWAVMKEGRKSAMRVFDRESMARRMAEEVKGTTIEFRPGERTRCEKYCSVRAFCHQYRRYKEGGK